MIELCFILDRRANKFSNEGSICSKSGAIMFKMLDIFWNKLMYSCWIITGSRLKCWQILSALIPKGFFVTFSFDVGCSWVSTLHSQPAGWLDIRRLVLHFRCPSWQLTLMIFSWVVMFSLWVSKYFVFFPIWALFTSNNIIVCDLVNLGLLV